MNIFKKVSTIIKHPSKISKNERGQMLKLMKENYKNVNKKTFLKDLDQKKWVFLLINRQKKIVGFTTLVPYFKKIKNQKIIALFSGDTIIQSNYRGNLSLPLTWLQFVYKLSGRKKNYYFFWFMLSKGYKTYRLLPRFFKHFYPSYNKEFPKDKKNILTKFAKNKFNNNYSAKTDIFIPNDNYFVKKGKKEIQKDLLKNPHIKFFFEKNVNFYKGHELVCFAEISKKNFNPLAKILILLGNSFIVKIFVFLQYRLKRS